MFGQESGIHWNIILTHWHMGDVVVISINNFVIFKRISMMDVLSICYENALRWLSQDFADD